MTTYSFCESNWAGSNSWWHIRGLTDVGKKLGGGIDTAGLCSRPKAREGWDLKVSITPHHLAKNTCPRCMAVYMKATATFKDGDLVKHTTSTGEELEGVVEVSQIRDGMWKHHVRWDNGDLLYYPAEQLEAASKDVGM